MHKKWLIVTILVLALAVGAAGQEADTSRYDVHLSTGATVAAGFGRTQALSWVAPSVELKASERMKVSGGFAAAGSLLDGYELHGYGPTSLAPRKQGTRLGALWAKASYRATDRLWLWASAVHVTGFAQPLWLDGALPVQATAVSGGLAYEFPQGSLLEMHFHIVHDRYGTLPPYPYGYGWYGTCAPRFDIYSGLWPY
ncbi:MAG: hypothetical protein IKP83_00755 [Bacteroidales bacterium]|nr:hypothetical protein [Bacteroidales bacterium]